MSKQGRMAFALDSLFARDITESEFSKWSERLQEAGGWFFRLSEGEAQWVVDSLREVNWEIDEGDDPHVALFKMALKTARDASVDFLQDPDPDPTPEVEQEAAPTPTQLKEIVHHIRGLVDNLEELVVGPH